MKYLILLVLITTDSMLMAQSLRPRSTFISYLGESVTHPGLKVGITYQLDSWEKVRTKKNGDDKLIQKSIDLSPSIGLFNHKGYQTGLFILPEWSFSRKNAKGNFISAGIGVGYLKTIIPNVYDMNSNGQIRNLNAGFHHVMTNYSLTFGKDLSAKSSIPIDLYIKPQLNYALLNVTKGVAYFMLELGVSYNWNK